MVRLNSVCVSGGKDFLMRAHFGLPSVEAEEEESRPPIKVILFVLILLSSFFMF